MKAQLATFGFALGLTFSAVAFGQDDDDMGDTDMEQGVEEAPPAVEEPAHASPAPQEASGSVSDLPAGPADGGRFRFGISGGPGLLLVDPVTLFYGGVDLRLGAQINDMIAIYAQPQLGFYTGTYGGTTGVGGLVGVSALADFTFSDRYFVGAGAGFGVLNNPSGPEIHFRGGFYPVMSRSAEKPRRKGLMLGVDFRLFFTSAGTGISPTVSIGYEAF